MTKVQMTCDHPDHRGMVVTIERADAEWRGCTYNRLGLPAFDSHPQCLKCGDGRFSWRYAEEAGYPNIRINGPHLHLTCERCGWQFNMRTRDDT